MPFQSFTHTKSHLVQFSQSIPFRNLTKLSYECLHILTNIFFFYLYRYGKHTNSNKNQYLRNMQRTTKKKQIKYEQQKRSHEKKLSY